MSISKENQDAIQKHLDSVNENSDVNAIEETPISKSDEGKTEDEIKVENEAIKLDEEKQEAEKGKTEKVELDAEGNPIPKQEVKVKSEIDSEAVLAYLKANNIEIDSIDALKDKLKPTEQKVELSNEDIKIKKLEINKWALQEGLIKADVLESYEKDSQISKIELAFQSYFEGRKTEFDELTEEPYTEESLRAEFEDEFLINEDEENPQRKRKEKLLHLMADSYFYKYKDLENIESRYDQQLQATQTELQIKTATETAYQELKKDGIFVPIKDDLGNVVNVKVPINDSIFSKLSVSPSDIETIDSNSVKVALVAKYTLANFPAIMNEACLSFHSQMVNKQIANSKGIEERKATIEFQTNGVPKEIAEALAQANLVN